MGLRRYAPAPPPPPPPPPGGAPGGPAPAPPTDGRSARLDELLPQRRQLAARPCMDSHQHHLRSLEQPQRRAVAAEGGPRAGTVQVPLLVLGVRLDGPL